MRKKITIVSPNQIYSTLQLQWFLITLHNTLNSQSSENNKNNFIFWHVFQYSQECFKVTALTANHETYSCRNDWPVLINVQFYFYFCQVESFPCQLWKCHRNLSVKSDPAVMQNTVNKIFPAISSLGIHNRRIIQYRKRFYKLLNFPNSRFSSKNK